MNENSKDLPWVEKIEASGSRNFTLPLHVEYQNEQYARVKAFDQGRLRTPGFRRPGVSPRAMIRRPYRPLSCTRPGYGPAPPRGI